MLSLRDPQGNEITSLDFGEIVPGQASDIIELRVWNDFGGQNGSDEARDVSLRVVNEQEEEAGDVVEMGWVECKVGSPDDTAFPLVFSEWQPIGRGRYPELGSIQSNTFRTVYLRLRVPPGAAGAQSFYIIPFAGTPSIPIDRVLYELSEDGVISEEGNAEFAVKDGIFIVADGTDTVYITPGTFYVKGMPKRFFGQEVQLNQYDGNGNPLTPEYPVYGVSICLYQDGTIEAMKGERQSTTPNFPSPPEGSVLIGRVTVQYSESGSQIHQDDVTWNAPCVEFFAVAIPLSQTFLLHVSPGRCIVRGKYVELGSPSTFVLQQGSSGTLGVSEYGEIVLVQDDAHILPLYEVSVSDTLIIKDKRHFVGSSGIWATAIESVAKGQPLAPVSASSVAVATSTRVAIGIAEHDADEGDKVFVVTHGTCLALVQGAHSAGDTLVVGTGGLVVDNSASYWLGVCLESGSSTELAYILLK